MSHPLYVGTKNHKTSAYKNLGRYWIGINYEKAEVGMSVLLKVAANTKNA